MPLNWSVWERLAKFRERGLRGRGRRMCGRGPENKVRERVTSRRMTPAGIGRERERAQRPARLGKQSTAH